MREADRAVHVDARRPPCGAMCSASIVAASCPSSASARPGRPRTLSPSSVIGVPAGIVDVRGDRVERARARRREARAGPPTSALRPSVARSRLRASSFDVDHRRLQRHAGALLPEAQRAVRVDARRRTAAPDERSRRASAVLEAEARLELGQLAPAGAEPVHVAVARDAADRRGCRRPSRRRARPWPAAAGRARRSRRAEVGGHHAERRDRPAAGRGRPTPARSRVGARRPRRSGPSVFTRSASQLRRRRGRAPRAAARPACARANLRSSCGRRADLCARSARASIRPSRRPPASARSSRRQVALGVKVGERQARVERQRVDVEVRVELELAAARRAEAERRRRRPCPAPPSKPRSKPTPSARYVS